jgi:hypothetical protein
MAKLKITAGTLFLGALLLVGNACIIIIIWILLTLD